MARKRVKDFPGAEQRIRRALEELLKSLPDAPAERNRFGGDKPEISGELDDQVGTVYLNISFAIDD